ncbi:hypothetical protein BJX65DRAFT_276473 [Aspergillus insuetus]
MSMGSVIGAECDSENGSSDNETGRGRVSVGIIEDSPAVGKMSRLRLRTSPPPPRCGAGCVWPGPEPSWTPPSKEDPLSEARLVDEPVSPDRGCCGFSSVLSSAWDCFASELGSHGGSTLSGVGGGISPRATNRGSWVGNWAGLEDGGTSMLDGAEARLSP